MTIGSGRRGNRRVALGAVGIMLAAIVITTLAGVDRDWVAESTAALRRNGADPEFMTDGSVGTILMRNGAVALFLFSGVISAGTSTLIGLTLTGLSSGITLALVVDASGWVGLITDVIWYGPLELCGFTCVAAAGVLPLITALRGGTELASTQRSGSTLGLYLAALPASLSLGAIGAGAIGLGAVIEAIVIALR